MHDGDGNAGSVAVGEYLLNLLLQFRNGLRRLWRLGFGSGSEAECSDKGKYESREQKLAHVRTDLLESPEVQIPELYPDAICYTPASRLNSAHEQPRTSSPWAKHF